MKIVTGRFREVIEITNTDAKVLLDCTTGDGNWTQTIHYWLEPAYAAEIAHAILAAVARVEQARK